MNHSIMFLDGDNKEKLVPLLLFRTLMRELIKSATKSLDILKKRFRNEEENSKYNISYVPVIDCSWLSNT